MKYSMARRITLLEQWTAIVRNFSDLFSVVFSTLKLWSRLFLHRYLHKCRPIKSNKYWIKYMQSYVTETNQILWFYSFFRFSIWKNYFQLSALPLFTLLRGPCSVARLTCLPIFEIIIQFFLHCTGLPFLFSIKKSKCHDYFTLFHVTHGFRSRVVQCCCCCFVV